MKEQLTPLEQEKNNAEVLNDRLALAVKTKEAKAIDFTQTAVLGQGVDQASRLVLIHNRLFLKHDRRVLFRCFERESRSRNEYMHTTI